MLQCGQVCIKTDGIDNLQDSTWEKIKNKVHLWRGLDKCGNVYDGTNSAAGPKGLFLHNSCRLQFSSGDKLEKANRRWEKAEIEGRKKFSARRCTWKYFGKSRP